MTSAMPTSIVVGMLIRVSTSHLTLSGGSGGAGSRAGAMTLSSSVSPADHSRWLCPVVRRRPASRRKEHQALQHEQVDQRQDAALRQHGEAEQQHHRRAQVDELAGKAGSGWSGRGGSRPVSSSRCTSMASTASRKAVPRNSGARKMRILALSVSIRPAGAADGQLDEHEDRRDDERQRVAGRRCRRARTARCRGRSRRRA
jgi:hypothetical protein